jgi:glycosyltransferase involved in cell wall biosynthesis
MKASSLDEVYTSVNPEAEIIYVVPLIRYSHKKSDYLYLLYEELIESQKYRIESVSVFNHFKLITGKLTRKNAILHYHWLEFQDLKSLMGMPWKLCCICLFKLLGGNIVWTLHNEFPHDQKYLKLHSFLHRKMASWADALHVHCSSAVKTMSEKLHAQTEKFWLVEHPDFPANPTLKNKAKKYLNNEYGIQFRSKFPVFLMFGNISRYKQIEKVAESIIEENLDCTLVIAGPVKKGNNELYKELEMLAEQDQRIHLVPRFIPEKHVSWFYSASDICVFNYREILSSGGYHMAKAYKKTVIAPDMGCLSDEKNKPMIHLFKSQKEMVEMLRGQITTFLHGKD